LALTDLAFSRGNTCAAARGDARVATGTGRILGCRATDTSVAFSEGQGSAGTSSFGSVGEIFAGASGVASSPVAEGDANCGLNAGGGPGGNATAAARGVVCVDASTVGAGSSLAVP